MKWLKRHGVSVSQVVRTLVASEYTRSGMDLEPVKPVYVKPTAQDVRTNLAGDMMSEPETSINLKTLREMNR